MSPAPALSENAACDPSARSGGAADCAAPRDVWTACGGGCTIRQSGPDAEVLDSQGNLRQRLSGMRFLPGAGRTDCLSAFGFIAADGMVTVLDAESLRLRETHALAPLYDVDFMAEPHFLETVAQGAWLSCDGLRLFAPSLDGVALSVLPLGAGQWDGDAIAAVPTAIIASPSGRYGLSVAEDGRYLVTDYQTGRSFGTDAVFEIDLPFFDVDETHLLVRREAPDGLVVTIIDLATGQEAGHVPYPEAGGLRFHLRDGALIPADSAP
ncbi:MAG: hypothetical protein Q4G25_15355 [Paracoccus sp. (in: a-proteobacteria)]|nr:hypothetical protein [Paracoccus sp. (in: a-proteobacteria)]